MAEAEWVPFRQAWTTALYGRGGFYRSALPADHFRTSVHASPLFARAIVTLVRRRGYDTVTDVGAGAGELLVQIHALAPDLRLVGVELRERPVGLPTAIQWRGDLEPSRGLVLANEVLDNIPVEVVEFDEQSLARVVEVDADSGEQRLGPPADRHDREWLSTWWPSADPGSRAEVGLRRDIWWSQVCGLVTEGLCLAVDYGHTRHHRPSSDTVTSYRDGRQTPLSLDTRHDVTSHVAVDAICSAVGGTLARQADALADLGVRAQRPAVGLAATDPAGYVRGLALASQAAELTSRTPRGDGLGDFYWMYCPRR